MHLYLYDHVYHETRMMCYQEAKTENMFSYSGKIQSVTESGTGVQNYDNTHNVLANNAR